LIFGLIYTILAILLILYGFGNPLRCLAKSARSLGRWTFPGHRRLFPVALGLLTGLNVCPPFLLAFASAAEMESLWGCLLFFLTFFAGTSIYLIPLSGLGLLRRHDFLRPIGRLAAGVIGVYYLCLGLLAIEGSLN
jgi:hypothetical protein